MPTIVAILILVFIFGISQQLLFAIGSDTLSRNNFHIAGDSLFEIKKFDEAHINFKIAAKIYHSDKLWEQEVICLNKAGNALRKNKNLDEALEILNKNLDLGIKYLNNDNENLAQTFHLKFLVYWSKGDYYQAGYMEEEAVKRWRVIYGEESYDVARGYNNAGLCNKNTGNFNRSLEYYKKALKIFEKVLDSLDPIVSRTINNLSVVYKLKGDYDKALEYSKRAIEITLTTNPVDSLRLANKYNNIGMIYSDLNDFAIAYRYYNLALDIRLNNLPDNHLDIAGTYNNIGRINNLQSNYIIALDYYYKSLQIYKSNYKTDHPDIAMCYYNISNNYRELQDFEKAIFFNSKALIIRTEFYRRNHPKIAKCYLNMSNIYNKKGKYKDALNYIESAINANSLNSQILSYKVQMSILSLRARIYKNSFNKNKDIKDLEKAISSYKEISVLVDNQRKSYESKGSMLELCKSVSENFSEAVRISHLLFEITNNNIYLNDAFFFAEKNKANVLVEAILESRSQNLSGVLDNLIQQEKELKIKLQACDQKRKDEIFHKGKRNSEKINLLENEFTTLNYKYDSLIKVFESNYKNYFQLKYSTSTISPSDVHHKLNSGSALIEYITSDSLVFIFIMTEDDISIKKVQVDSLDNFILNLRIALSELSANKISNNSIKSYSYYAGRLYDLLINPIEEKSDVTDLIIIPDGKMGYIPFEVLLTKRIAGSEQDFKSLPYLIKKYSVSYGNSATIVFDLLYSLKCEAENSFLGLAPFTESNQKKNIGRYRDTLILTDLPSSKQEIETIQKLIGGKILLDSSATKQIFLSLAKNYKILHIATHGIVDDLNPLESGLFFYPNNSEFADELKISELFSLSFNSEMAVLSACNTGYGKLERGEGIMSLARGFSYAGVPGVAMSLWNVNDKSTADIMYLFYEYLKKGYLRNEALRKAKLDYIEKSDKIFASPYYWGGFVYIGKNDSIDFDNDYFNYWLLLALIPFFAIGFYLYKRNKV